MKAFVRAVGGFFFLDFFLVFLLLGTLRFELLNSSFLFPSLQRGHVYEKIPSDLVQLLPNAPGISPIEQAVYVKVLTDVSPTFVKTVVDENINSILSYINGPAKDITLSLPLSQLNIPMLSDMSWSLSSVPELRSNFAAVQGIGLPILLVLVILLFSLILFVRALGRTLLLIASIVSALLGVVGSIFFVTIATNTPLKEPIQVVLVLLSSSVFSDMTISWIALGIILFFMWLTLKILAS